MAERREAYVQRESDKGEIMKALQMPKVKTLAEIIGDHKDVVISELAERMRDIIYMTAEEKAREIVKSLEGVLMNGEDTIDVEYEFSFVVNDIFQIVGRAERESSDAD